MENLLKEGLKLVDISPELSIDKQPFIWVGENYDNISRKEEYFAVQKAKALGAVGVYFRRFPNNRSSVPQIYIYDYTQKKFDDVAREQINKTVWSSNTVPLCYIFTQTDIKIINTTKPFDKKVENVTPFDNVLSNLSQAAEAKQQLKERYSAKLLAYGTFWDLPSHKTSFNAQDIVSEKLIIQLRKSREKFLHEIGLSKELANHLLILSILVKYLEERTGLDGAKVFPESFFHQYDGATNFCETVENGKIIALFDYLNSEDKFNGKIFELSQEEKNELNSQNNLSALVNFLKGDNEDGQYVLWRLYSFNHLPVELISRIYEEFIPNQKKSDGVVYTPAHLAAFLTDVAMPVSDYAKVNRCAVLDPACSSGVFLVLAFKRIIEWWIINNMENDNTDSEITPIILKELLKQNIFGTDINKTATQLTNFSLMLAVCDHLSPTVIWNELKFEDLSQNNVLHQDFFTFVNNTNKKFDVIIGNPPFVRKKDLNTLIKTLNNKPKENIPQKQLAFLFLDQAINLLKDTDSGLCLLLPVVTLVYSDEKNELAFRKHLFANNHVMQIIDFTPLKESLFKNANVAVAAICLTKQITATIPTLHIVVRSYQISEGRIYFELDTYDFHPVDKETLLNNPYVWKANLMGGGRLPMIIEHFSPKRTLGAYLEEKEKYHGWYFREGYFIGNKKQVAEHITNKPTILAKYFTEEGIDFAKIQNIVETETLFEAPRIPEIFDGTRLLIKENLGKNTIPIALISEYRTFKNDIIAIRPSITELADIHYLHDTIKKNNDIYRLLIACKSSKLFIHKATVCLKKDIEYLPYPENAEELELSNSETIIQNDVLNYMIDWINRGLNSIIHKKTTPEELQAFGEVFCIALNSVYQEGDKCFRQGAILRTTNFILNSFVYTNEEQHWDITDVKDDKLEATLQQLLQNDNIANLLINRRLIFYSNDNTIYLLKPQAIRFWLKSIALRDVDEVFADLIEKGY